MPSFIGKYIAFADALSAMIGRVVLYGIFLLMGILLYSTISRYMFDSPVIWGVELAQFVMVSYYILGGGFALLLNSHVRLDVFYSRWSTRGQARADFLTSFFLLVYLGFLLYGCVSSTLYSIQFNQHNNTAWGPAVWPVKAVMGVGILVTLLQALSETCKAWARSRGIEVNDMIPERALVEGEAEPEITEEMRSPFFPAGLPLPELAMQHLHAVRDSLVRYKALHR